MRKTLQTCRGVQMGEAASTRKNGMTSCRPEYNMGVLKASGLGPRTHHCKPHEFGQAAFTFRGLHPRFFDLLRPSSSELILVFCPGHPLFCTSQPLCMMFHLPGMPLTNCLTPCSNKTCSLSTYYVPGSVPSTWNTL